MAKQVRRLAPADVAALRLRAQHLAGPKLATPGEVVRWFGAVQAQDYRGALWAIGQRAEEGNQADVEAAIAAREIVRCWPMRHTLHFVAADDAKWLPALLVPRAMQKAKSRHLGLGLDARTFAAAGTCFEKLLGCGKSMTRPEAYAALEGAKISAEGQRGIHILAMLAMQGVLCFGPHRDKQPTFVLLDAWLPKARALAGDEALGEIATRYFTSHGPASARDFAWWTGLALGEARRAVEIAGAQLVPFESEGEAMFGGKVASAKTADPSIVRLLPSFDEYLVAYKNRDAVLDGRHAPRLGSLLAPVIELGGRIVGTWGRRVEKKRVALEASPFARLDAAGRRGLEAAADRYGVFLGLPAELSIR